MRKRLKHLLLTAVMVLAATLMLSAPASANYFYDTTDDGYIAYPHAADGYVVTLAPWCEEGIVGYASFEYDAAGNCTSIALEYKDDSSVRVITIDAAGNPASVVGKDSDGNLQWTDLYTYDTAGNMTYKVYKDSDGNIERTFAYVYDAAGNLLSEVWKDADGNLEYSFVYTYDSSGKLRTKVIKNGDGSTLYSYAWTYDAAGDLRTEVIKDGNGYVLDYMKFTYTYDEAGNVLSEVIKEEDGSIRNSNVWTYDEAGNVLSWAVLDSNGNAEWSREWTYDAAGNELSEIQKNGNGNLEFSFTWTYDAAGNLITEVLEDSDGNLLDTRYWEYQKIDLPCSHSYTDTVTAPTCTAKGYTTHTCSKCGDSYTDTETAALGHSFTNYSYNNDAGICKNGTETATCDRGCGTTNTRTKAGSALPDPNEKNPFLDVPPGQYYYNPVLWAVENKITSGTSATTFEPETKCSRAQVVTFLWRAAGRPAPTTTVNPFTDVKEGQYYYKAVLWAVENKITSGTSATTFSPDEPCTRAQVVAFQWRAAGRPEPTSTTNPFTDVKEGLYYYKAVLWALENKITAGTSKTEFSPNQICTRGQIVTFIYRQLRNK